MSIAEKANQMVVVDAKKARLEYEEKFGVLPEDGDDKAEDWGFEAFGDCLVVFRRDREVAHVADVSYAQLRNLWLATFLGRGK